MQISQKRYNIVVTGRVQDIGFRDFVEKLANFIGLKGYIFNDIDGSVKMTLEGKAEIVDSFLKDIKSKTKNVGAEIDSIEKQEISTDFYLPPRFIKIPSTEYEELGRKFDVGVELLSDIKSDTGGMTSDLGDIKSDIGSIKSDIGSIKSDIGSIKSDIGDVNAGIGDIKSDTSLLRDIKDILGKIAEKI